MERQAKRTPMFSSHRPATDWKRSGLWTVFCAIVLSCAAAIAVTRASWPAGRPIFGFFPYAVFGVCIIRAVVNIVLFFLDFAKKNWFSLAAAISWLGLAWALRSLPCQAFFLFICRITSDVFQGVIGLGCFFGFSFLAAVLMSLAIHRFSGHRRAADWVAAVLIFTALLACPRSIFDSLWYRPARPTIQARPVGPPSGRTISSLPESGPPTLPILFPPSTRNRNHRHAPRNPSVMNQGRNPGLPHNPSVVRLVVPPFDGPQ